MPPRKTAKPAARTASRKAKPPSPWSQLNDALNALLAPLWSVGRLITTHVWAWTPVVGVWLLIVLVVGGRLGCSTPLGPLGPATSLSARADQLAVQHGFTAEERSKAGAVFLEVAKQIRDGKQSSATSVDSTTRGSLGKAFGDRWATTGNPWINSLKEQWKGRFGAASPPDAYEPLWREIAAGLGVR